MKLNQVLIGGFLIVALLVGIVGVVSHSKFTEVIEVSDALD